MTGHKIKEYIKSKGISQTFVSNKTGIPISTLAQMLDSYSTIEERDLHLGGGAATSASSSSASELTFF